MDTMNHIVRIKKTVCMWFSLFNKMNLMKAMAFNPTFPVVVMLEPSYPQEFHGLECCLGSWDNVHYIGMKNAKYTCISKWVVIPTQLCIRRECHDVRVYSWIQTVLGMPHIVCCVVDSNNLVAVDTVMLKQQTPVVFQCILMVLGSLIWVENLLEKVIFEFAYEILHRTNSAKML